MSHAARAALREAVLRLGPELADDPRRCRAALADLCPGERRAVHALVAVVEEGLAAQATQEPLERARLTARLHAQTALAAELCAFAVEAWANALGGEPPTAGDALKELTLRAACQRALDLHQPLAPITRLGLSLSLGSGRLDALLAEEAQARATLDEARAREQRAQASLPGLEALALTLKQRREAAEFEAHTSAGRATQAQTAARSAELALEAEARRAEAGLVAAEEAVREAALLLEVAEETALLGDYSEAVAEAREALALAQSRFEARDAAFQAAQDRLATAATQRAAQANQARAQAQKARAAKDAAITDQDRLNAQLALTRQERSALSQAWSAEAKRCPTLVGARRARLCPEWVSEQPLPVMVLLPGEPPFWLAATATTRRQFQTLTGVLPPPEDAPLNEPVGRVTWLEAVQACNALSRLEGLPEAYPDGQHLIPNAIGYRLPTELECAFAAQGLAQGWHAENAGGRVHRVAALPPNALGLYDLPGNTWTWITPTPEAQSGKRPTVSNYWGGSISSRPADLGRAQGFAALTARFADLGFRIARSA